MISVKRQWSGCTWENYVDLQYAAVVNTTEDAYLVKEYYSLLSVIKILYHTTKDYTMVKSDIPWISKLTLGCQPKHALSPICTHSFTASTPDLWFPAQSPAVLYHLHDFPLPLPILAITSLIILSLHTLNNHSDVIHPRFTPTCSQV